MADEHAGDASGGRSGDDDDELASRLADIHRRSEQLAERVASFRSETEQLTTDGPSEPDDQPEQPAQPEQQPEEPEQPAQPERRHRPRPSASAPLVYDDDSPKDSAGTDDSHTDSDGDVAPAQENEPAEKSAEKTDEKTDEKTAKRPEKDSGKSEEKDKPKRRGMPSWVRKVRNLVITVVIIAAAALALRTWVVEPFYVPSASMEPTLHGCSGCNDDHVLVQKLSYYFHDPRRGDIIVFDKPANWHVPDSELIKRVIGVPGDKVVLRKGRVYVNGSKLDEPYVNKKCKQGTQPESKGPRFKVPKGKLFVMGDNRCNSDDSRDFKYVPIDDVVGKAMLIYWPVKDFGSP